MAVLGHYHVATTEIDVCLTVVSLTIRMAYIILL